MTEPRDSERDDELASALLDGEAEPTERAVVDEAVRARMAQFAAVRDAVRDVPPPADEARRTAMAAALGTWDEARRGTSPVVAPSRPARASSRPAWFLGVAAAAVVAAVAGVVVSGGLGGSDDDSTAIEDAATMSEEAADETSLRTESAAGLADATDDADELAATEAAPADGADELEAPEAGGGAAAETTAASAEAPAATVVVDLVGPDALAAFAASTRSADVAPTACDAAGLGEVVGTARYAPAAGDVPVDVVVTVDDAAQLVRGLDATTCDVVVESPTR